ncbi:IS110 family transposase [Natranaerofaba carboxydovora]|uniref:IS110 family transposase n=1 Tax=Natranaerofaba carboxydovora TaxID=2742683 RepID=UPI001F12C2E0|nr:IS110 family transposase [Natranaerofaba carboxydovora]UMZ74224.1 Transposase [Natranaerofaba carboxydovora]UMZ74608.1 Transposase [Natranaerofaba carboxydovora]
MFFGGIDIAKHKHEVCIIDAEGNSVLSINIHNRKKGVDKLLSNFERLGITTDNCKFCLEATGHYWLSLYYHLTELGYEVHVINPIQSHAIRNFYIRKTKTDLKDAFILADMVRFGRLPQSELASETVMKLQTLSRHRFDLVRSVGDLKNKVLAILDRVFPEYPECFSGVFINSSKKLLQEFSSPEELADVDLSELTEFLKKHSRGRFGSDKAQQVKDLAKGTFGINLAADAYALELRLLMEQIEFVEDQINTIEEAIDQVMEEMRPSEDTEYRHVLETVPGIGPTLAAAIIGEVGDIHRFKNAKALVAFAGIDASVYASGEFEGSKNKMSKRGSPVLRHSLWMAAVSARRFNPELKEFYEKKKQEGKHSNVATGAVARKLVHMIFSLWKNNRPYQSNYKWSPDNNS